MDLLANSLKIVLIKYALHLHKNIRSYYLITAVHSYTMFCCGYFGVCQSVKLEEVKKERQ